MVGNLKKGLKYELFTKSIEKGSLKKLFLGLKNKTLLEFYRDSLPQIKEESLHLSLKPNIKSDYEGILQVLSQNDYKNIISISFDKFSLDIGYLEQSINLLKSIKFLSLNFISKAFNDDKIKEVKFFNYQNKRHCYIINI